MIGLLLSVLILIAQLYWGVVGTTGMHGRELSIFAPYAVLMICVVIYHAVRTPWLISNEHLEAIQDEKSSKEKIETELQREREASKADLKHERDLVQQPDISLEWAWTEDQAKLLSRGDEKNIVVHNRSSEYVYNVQIDPIPLFRGFVFDEITEIAPGEKRLAVARWNGKSTQNSRYIEFFMCAEAEAASKGWYQPKPNNRGLASQWFKIPMSIRYRSKNASWLCELEFTYDVGSESFFTRLGGRRVYIEAQNTGSIPSSAIS
jgi:hypothetical protein